MCLHQRSGGGGGGGGGGGRGGALYGDLLQLAGPEWLALHVGIEEHLVQTEYRSGSSVGQQGNEVESLKRETREITLQSLVLLKALK